MKLNFLEKYGILNEKNSFYVEAGANDGIMNSISYYLEKEHNWNGILIDPCFKNIEACKKNRSKNNIFVHGALVSQYFTEKRIKGNFSLNPGESSAKSKVESVIDLWPPKNGSKADTEVDAYKFSEICEKNKINDIDLFILDVEGYEFEVLQGINFDISPKFFIIEIRKDHNLSDIVNFLYSKKYYFLEDLDNSKENDSLTNFLFKKIEGEDEFISCENVLKRSWDHLIDNSVTVRIGDSNNLKNSISREDISIIFTIILRENNFLLYHTSSGNYIIKIESESKREEIANKFSEIRIRNLPIKIHITNNLK